MINTEFKEYKFGKNCASEFISECINKHVYSPEGLSKKAIKDIVRSKIDLANKLITDNNQVSFNQGYKHTMEDFLHFITK